MSANAPEARIKIISTTVEDEPEEQLALPAGFVSEDQTQLPGVPKKITNAQTVCNVKNEKGKLCNGHLKQLRTGGEEAEIHLRGDDVLFKCQSCATLYMGPPLGHVRDPQKQARFVERELAALLEAAGGTLPAFKRSASGAWVPAEQKEEAHAPAAKPAAAKPAPAKPAAAEGATPAPKPAAARAAGPRPASGGKGVVPPLPAHLAPPPGETFEQKRARLARVVVEAKTRAGKDVPPALAELAAKAPPPRTSPAANVTSGTDSSASADAHRPAAEAQAATGQASAAPMSPAAATASPAAGAETPEDLAPEASTELTPGAPRDARADAEAPPKKSASHAGFKVPPELQPKPGETQEEKIERLRRTVEAAKRAAGKL